MVTVNNSATDILIYTVAMAFFTWAFLDVRNRQAAPEGYATTRATHDPAPDARYRYRYDVDGHTHHVIATEHIQNPSVHYDPDAPTREPILYNDIARFAWIMVLGWLIVIAGAISAVI